ncbi:MAG: hypothetical protein JSV70_05805 [bacterium]|nr:MAG: hypothetical protein JSV70_05805 [bacterium]
MMILILLSALFVGASQARAMRFSHIVHDKNEISRCEQCHKPGAVSIIPERDTCYECHGEKEIEETVLGPTKTHTPLWVRQHGIDSESAGAQCSGCHTISFCVDCHKGGELGVDLKKRAVRMDTVPSTHTSRFRIVHPLKATAEQIEKCYTCHSRSDCVECHESYRNKFPGREIVSHQKSWELLIAGDGVPDHTAFTLNQCQDCHPGGALSSAEWSRGHAKEARRTLSSCQSCHPDGNACLACHSSKTGLKISPHPGNWRKIQGKFRRESPEVCAKCH